MKRFMMVLVALVMALVMAAGALAEGLEIASGTGVDAAVPEVEVELGAPEGEPAVSNDGEPTVPNDEGELMIPVDAAHFPDAVFRDYVSRNFDLNKDGWLDEDEMDEVERIVVSGLGITSLQGIEYFYGLLHLDCSGNRGLTTIDVSKNENLEFFSCYDCNITNLDLSGHEGLATLFITENPLKSLNLDGCESLTVLTNNQIPETIESLSLKDCMSLVQIDCSKMPLTSLDVSDCESLESLCLNYCYSLISVNLADADELRVFSAKYAKITDLDLSDNVELRYLNTTGCYIGSLDLTECEELSKIVRKNDPVCDGPTTHFGAYNSTYGYQVDITSTTNLIADSEAIYSTEFKMDKTGTQSITVGDKVQLNLVYYPEGLKQYGGKVTWASSNDTIASVSGSGLVKGLRKGKTVIAATAPFGAIARVTFNVKAKLPKKVKLNKKGVVKLEKGKKLKLTATFKPKDAESKLTWTTSDADVATVSQKGKVKAVGYGTATITVTTENGKSAKVKIMVPKPKKKK